MTAESNTNNMPSEQEIQQQKSEAYQALSSFHETVSSTADGITTGDGQSVSPASLLAGLDLGLEDEDVPMAECWDCKDGAITYVVPMDPAAGLKKGVISKPYKSNVQIQMDFSSLLSAASGAKTKKKGLRLVETIQFVEKDGTSSSMPFSRSIALGANIDVDSVDGSYSLDDTLATNSDTVFPLPLLPPSLLVGGIQPTDVKMVVEHTVAVSELERSRCFLLYGDADGGETGETSGETDETGHNYRLLGVVLSEETKKLPQQANDGIQDAVIESSDLFDLGQSKPPSPLLPLDVLEINQDSDDSKVDDDKMDKLFKALDKHNKRVMESASSSSEDGTPSSTKHVSTMEKHSMGMFGLSSGVWLGDTFIREAIPSKDQLDRIRETRQMGFGKSTSKSSSKGNNKESEDGFGNWHIGVQKATLNFQWDYDSKVVQSYEFGKCFGTMTSTSCMANSKSSGTVVVNEGRAMKKREERRVIWDMDGGAYVAGLIGSSYFRAPRYMTFSQSRSSLASYLTEFIVFYKPAKEAASTSSDDDTEKAAEHYASRIARLYNSNDGGLLQGSTAFFSLKQHGI